MIFSQNRAKVYTNNFKPVCYSADGKLNDRTASFLDRLKSAKVDFSDTLLWWVAAGYDSPMLLAEAIKEPAPNRRGSSAVSTN